MDQTNSIFNISHGFRPFNFQLTEFCYLCFVLYLFESGILMRLEPHRWIPPARCLNWCYCAAGKAFCVLKSLNNRNLCFLGDTLVFLFTNTYIFLPRWLPYNRRYTCCGGISIFIHMIDAAAPQAHNFAFWNHKTIKTRILLTTVSHLLYQRYITFVVPISIKTSKKKWFTSPSRNWPVAGRKKVSFYFLKR